MTSVIIAVKTILNITAYLPRRPVKEIALSASAFLHQAQIRFMASNISFLVVSESIDSQISQRLDKSHCLFWKHDHRAG
jgi:hypothetical protein